MDDDFITRYVLVLDTQKECFDALYDELLSNRAKIPEEISDEFGEKLLREYFDDIPDPRPTVHDLKAVLSAYQRGVNVLRHTLDARAEIDPKNLARLLIDEKVAFHEGRERIKPESCVLGRKSMIA